MAEVLSRDEAAVWIARLRVQIKTMPVPKVPKLFRLPDRPPCPECGATVADPAHQADCSRGVLRTGDDAMAAAATTKRARR